MSQPIGSLDHSPLRDWGESPGPGGASDAFEVDTEDCGVLDEVLATAAVDPDLAQGGVFASGLLEQGATSGGVLNAGCADQHRKQQAEASVVMPRSRSTAFLPASMPGVPAGTEVEVLTRRASITQAEGWRCFLPAGAPAPVTGR